MHNHTILVADDSESDALLIEHRLKKCFPIPSIHWVQDGVQAIAYLNGEGEFGDRKMFPFPSVLLLDLQMPKRDGFQVLEWIKQEPTLHRLIVVVMSSVDDEDAVKRVYSMGAHAFLHKCCTQEQIQHLAMFLNGFFKTAWSNNFVLTKMNLPSSRVEAS